jgi:hypothetical protein
MEPSFYTFEVLFRGIYATKVEKRYQQTCYSSGDLVLLEKLGAPRDLAFVVLDCVGHTLRPKSDVDSNLDNSIFDERSAKVLSESLGCWYAYHIYNDYDCEYRGATIDLEIGHSEVFEILDFINGTLDYGTKDALALQDLKFLKENAKKDDTPRLYNWTFNHFGQKATLLLYSLGYKFDPGRECQVGEYFGFARDEKVDSMKNFGLEKTPEGKKFLEETLAKTKI